jgi:predicted  nucleic acid-binding Zn-ribbon protein
MTHLDDTLFLGRLDTANQFISLIRPLAELRGGRWIKVEDAIARFPKQGLVRADKNDLGHGRVGTGSMWVFGLKPITNGAQAWAAVQPQRAVPMVDLSEVPLAEARYHICERGISLPEHQVRHAIVLLENDRCCSLRFEPKEHLWVPKLSDSVVDIRPAEATWKHCEKVDGSLFWPGRGEPIGLPEQFDWSSDREILSKAVDGYRRAVSAYFTLNGKQGDTVSRRIEKVFSEAKAWEPRALEGLAHRMRLEWPHLSRSLRAVESIGELLLQSEAAQRHMTDLVDRRSGEEVDRIREELYETVGKELATHREELAALKAEVQATRHERDSVAASVEALNAGRDAAMARAESAKGELDQLQREVYEAQGRLVGAKATLDELVAQASTRGSESQSLLQRIENLRTVLNTFRESFKRGVHRVGMGEEGQLAGFAAELAKALGEEVETLPSPPPAIAPWATGKRLNAVAIAAASLAARLDEEGRRFGIDVEDLRLVDGFARAGELVLICGEHADLTLQAYARCVAAGELRVHALDPSALGLDDLWRTPSTGRPTALAIAWQRAESAPDETVLVCLRDFDSAPYRLWLDSLVAVLCSPSRPRNLTVLATPCGQPSSDREEACGEALRHRIVAVKPRQANNQLAEIVFDEPAEAATLLVHQGPPQYRPSRAVFNAIAKRDRSVQSTRRVLRALGALQEVDPSAERIAKSWADHLAKCNPELLPPALADGHRELDSLHHFR